MSRTDLLGVPKGPIKILKLTRNSTGAGAAGTTGTTVRTFDYVEQNLGNLTWIHDTVMGDSIRIPADGLYYAAVSDRGGATIGSFGITINSTSLTGTPATLPVAQIFVQGNNLPANQTGTVSGIRWLRAGDILRYQVTAVASPADDPSAVWFIVAKLV